MCTFLPYYCHCPLIFSEILKSIEEILICSLQYFYLISGLPMIVTRVCLYHNEILNKVVVKDIKGDWCTYKRFQERYLILPPTYTKRQECFWKCTYRNPSKYCGRTVPDIILFFSWKWIKLNRNGECKELFSQYLRSSVISIVKNVQDEKCFLPVSTSN